MYRNYKSYWTWNRNHMKRKLLTGLFVASSILTGLVLYTNLESQFRTTNWCVSVSITRQPNDTGLFKKLEVGERLYQEHEFHDSERRRFSLSLGACMLVTCVLLLVRQGRFSLRGLILSAIIVGTFAAIPFLKVHAEGPPQGAIHYNVFGLPGPSSHRVLSAQKIEHRLEFETARTHTSSELQNLARDHRMSVRVTCAATEKGFHVFVMLDSETPIPLDQMKSFVAFYLQYADVLAREVLPADAKPVDVVPTDSEWAQRHAATFEAEYLARNTSKTTDKK